MCLQFVLFAISTTECLCITSDLIVLSLFVGDWAGCYLIVDGCMFLHCVCICLFKCVEACLSTLRVWMFIMHGCVVVSFELGNANHSSQC